MYIRRATVKSLDPTDREKLANFIHNLRTHSMYRPIIDELIASPGFVKKEYIMRDDKDGETFFSTVEFDSQETFNNYINNEVNQSLWDYLKIMAEQEGFSISVIDTFES